LMQNNIRHLFTFIFNCLLSSSFLELINKYTECFFKSNCFWWRTSSES